MELLASRTLALALLALTATTPLAACSAMLDTDSLAGLDLGAVDQTVADAANDQAPPADQQLPDQGSDGGSDASTPDGSALDGSALDGSALDGSALDGSALDGSALDGSALDGSALDGSALDSAADDDATGLADAAPDAP